jgi:hypothetical protein
MYEIIILQNDKLIYQNRFIKVEWYKAFH